MKPLTRALKVLDLEIEGILEVKSRLGREFLQAVDLCLNVLRHRGKIVVVGVGKSGHIGDKISATLRSTGSPSVTLNALNAAHGDLGMVGREDLVLAISSSGETTELINILPSLKRIGVKLIAFTGKPDSTLARYADVHLNTSVRREACPLNLAPTASTTATLALGDALAMVLLEAQGFKKEDFAHFHPGGTLGRNLLLGVREVMRPLEQVAVCSEHETVDAALARITEKRCGAAIIVAKNGVLSGIFTHGDFVRAYQKDRKIGARSLLEVMTRNPIQIQDRRLAVEVLRVFEKHQIEDLVVVEPSGKPVGLVDAQDLAKMNLL